MKPRLQESKAHQSSVFVRANGVTLKRVLQESSMAVSVRA
jgi:hypothetical protein